MDTNQFRKVSQPNVYSNYSKVNVNKKQLELPLDNAPDNRYNKWPAMMTDGRLTTNYNNHCSQNVPTGSQFPTKQWMIHNTDQLIQHSRTHQMPYTKSLDKSVVVPPVSYVKCSKSECTFTPNISNGVGVERMNTVPELFGTFAQQESIDKPNNPMVTHYYEGGRNTVRGTTSNLQKVYHLD